MCTVFGLLLSLLFVTRRRCEFFFLHFLFVVIIISDKKMLYFLSLAIGFVLCDYLPDIIVDGGF